MGVLISFYNVMLTSFPIKIIRLYPDKYYETGLILRSYIIHPTLNEDIEIHLVMKFFFIPSYNHFYIDI